MSNYWKKKLDELEKSKAQNTAKKTEKTDYWQNKMTELEKETERKKADIAPVKQTVKDEEDKGSFGKWLGNTAMGGLASFNKNITATADLILGGPLKALGWEDNPISKMADYYSDSYDEYKKKATVEAKLLGSDKNIAGMGNEYELAGAITESTVAALPTAITALMTMGTSLGGTAASMGGSAASSSLATTAAMRSGDLLTKAGLTAQTMAKNPQYWLSFAQTYGSDYEEAVKSGVDENVALYGSLISSLVNAGVEIGIDGGSGIQGLPNKVAEGGKSAIFEWVQSSLEEGGEEILQGVVSRAVSKMTGGDETVLDGGQMLTEGAMGTVVGGLLGGGQIGVQSATNAVTNAVQEAQENKLTETEQKVYDKVVESRIAEEEADGKELTAKEKKAIEKQVRHELDKGYISTDTIEETLGGDTYKTYRDTVDSEDALREEFDTLNQMKQGEMTGEQMDRRTELKQQLEDLKTNSQRDQLKAQLSDEVFNLAKDTRLAESYNEQSRRGNAFEADLSKYDTKQQTVVQKAIDSGILNNTNRTHEFVDMIAKISADKGVSFDFTNNAKLKESGFAVDGATVNGYVTKDGITLNIDSSKSTRSVAGHEITHILEGTELYTELQNTIFEYAKSKGEYDSRLAALTKLYENVDGADVNAELTADLVGDYLFDDVDFINNLSTKHRNVFEKIYDEIKYLCKVATAGSKEARELERVRKAFADAYRADSQASGDTKYSLSAETDKTYMDAVNRGDTDAVQKMVDKAAKNAGYTIKAYHGTQAGDFTVFDKGRVGKGNDQYGAGFYFTTDKEGASHYGNRVVNAALDIKNPIRINASREAGRNLIDADITLTSEQAYEIVKRHPDIYDAEESPLGDYYDSYWENGVQDWMIEDLAEQYSDVGYLDSDLFRNYPNELHEALRDVTGYDGVEVTFENGEKFYVAWFDNQMKSTDPVTYDDNGKVIPLSERFNSTKNDIRYSLSADSKGRKLSKEQQEFFADSKIRVSEVDGWENTITENGALLPVYHGTNSGEFYEFDKATQGSANDYGWFGKGFYFAFTEGEASYYGNRVLECYLNVKNPFVYDEEMGAFDGQSRGDTNFDFAAFVINMADKFPDIAQNIFVGVAEHNSNEVVEKSFTDFAKEIRELYDDDRLRVVEIDDRGKMIYQYRYSSDVDSIDAPERIKTLIKKHYIYSEWTANWELENSRITEQDYDEIIGLFEKYGEEQFDDVWLNYRYNSKESAEKARLTAVVQYLGDHRYSYLDQHMPHYYMDSVVANAFSEELRKRGYDGVLQSRYGDEVVVFDSNQIKLTSNKKPTSSPDMRYSLSRNGEKHRYGRGDGPMRDLALNDVAPVQDSVQDVAPVAQKEMTADDMIGALWDAEFKMQGYDPNAEADASEQAARDAFKRIGDKDAPPETEAPYYGESKPERANDPFLNRDWDERTAKAFVTDNPDAKPFFQEEAQRLAADYAYTEKAERGFSQEQYYNSGGERGFYGWSRMAADDINTLMDVYGLSYAQIEDGLDAIIHDTPKVNNKPAKTIEFILNKRMLGGYKAYYSGEYIPPNQGYIEWLNGQQNAAEYGESIAALTDADAPMDIAPTADSLTAPDVMPIAEAPVAQQYEAIKPKAEKEPRMARATPAEQARADILTEEPQKDKKKGGVWSKIKNNVLDKGMVFEDLSLATGNRELQARWNSIRYAEGKAQRLMGEGNASVKSLNSIRDAVDKTGKTQQFYEYLYHQHNVDRMTLAERYENVPNKTVFGDAVTADVSRTAVAELENANPEFKQYAKDVYDYMTYLRGLLVEGGVISNETAKLWQEMYPHYVPIRRLGDEGLNINVPLDTGRTGVNAPIKRAKGGNRDILPLFDTMGQRTIQTFKAIAKNRFGVELKNTLGTTIESDALGVDDAIDSIDTQDGLLQEGKNGKKPTFTVFENGEKVTFEITDEMYDAMKPTSEGLAYTNKVLNTVGNIRRGTLTEYNPWFMLKNAVKDVQDVLINSQHATRTYAAIPKAIKQMATKGHWYQEYLDNGGEQNTYFDNETNTFAKENKALEIAKKVTGLDAISKANNIIERLPRLAEYIASREAGRSVDVSMLDAARVTTNFAAGGDLAKFANRNGATFLNASIQGAMQQARNIREAKANGLKGWAKLAGVYTLAGLPALLLNHLIWDDDEEYEELSDYVKQNYYIVGKYGDGKFVRIPRGRTVAVIQNAFKQMDNAITGDDEVDLKSFVDLVVTNLAPNNPVDNNILSPIIQVANNETWYGEDLVPTRLQDLPAAEQYDESTDAISRWLGEKTNTSPYKINYLLDQYSGVVGDTFLPMLTPEAESGDNTFGGNMVAPLKDMFSTDSVMKNQNVSDFYDKVDELTTNAKGSKATDEDVLKSKYINSVSTELGKLYGKKREIQNGDLPDDIKYNQVREIQRQIDEMAKEALDSYGSVSVTDKYATVGDLHYRWYEPSEDSTAEAGWRKISNDELAKQNEVTRGLGITPAQYWNNKAEYDMQYKYPEKYAILQEQGISVEEYKEKYEDSAFIYTDAFSSMADNPGKYAISKVVTGDVMEFSNLASTISKFEADKDENGKSISGSKKEKVTAYIESLDLDYGQKLILHRSYYDSKEDKAKYNQAIVEYLDSREDISWEDMKTILEELDFTVYDDGRITW